MPSLDRFVTEVKIYEDELHDQLDVAAQRDRVVTEARIYEEMKRGLYQPVPLADPIVPNPSNGDLPATASPTSRAIGR
jgi:hypothetical protein